ncbi:ACP S-malonyltransferase [Streptomyces cyaneofuscatus]|uniref:ACP S-malonyltransferase n=1 Tax=Streptomyces cyaneofuscatus TaxID=66883 RepID=UPI0036B540B9
MNSMSMVFPGQGSQRVGMGRDALSLRPDLLDEYYRRADDLLGMDLSRLCWEGPAESLGDTANTQPAILLTSVVTFEVLRARGIEPAAVAGHSLGEYAALVAAGALEWTDALRLVRLRGELMAAVNTRVPGTMAAVVGLPLSVVEGLCRAAADDTGQVVEVANENEPAQTVVSGTHQAVQQVSATAREAGATRIVRLSVGAPFHCSLMRSIEAEYADALADVDFRDPRIPVVSTVTGRPLADAGAVIGALRLQLTGRVRWTQAVREMTASGIDTFIEVGPGKVLSGLCRRIAPGSRTHTTYDARQLDRTTHEFAVSAR